MIEALEREALRAWVGDLAAAPGRWAPHVRHRADQRIFVPLDAPTGTEAWLICWMPGHDTGFHDHDHSSGAVAVVTGQIREERIGAGWEVTRRTYGPGEVIPFVSGNIHRMLHVGDEPAVSIHVYSPKLQVMGAYAFGTGGMQRHLLGPEDELKPLSAAG
jgi:quercetin dioxygenase-like cupin family protein